MFSESTGFTSFNFSVCKANYFCCVINCLNINRVTICSANCPCIVIFKKLPAIFFRYNARERHKNPDSEIKAKENSYHLLCASSVIKCLKDFEKMTGF